MSDAILARWKEFTPLQQRKAAAILGALVADAAGRLIAVMMWYKDTVSSVIWDILDQNHTLIEIMWGPPSMPSTGSIIVSQATPLCKGCGLRD